MYITANQLVQLVTLILISALLINSAHAKSANKENVGVEKPNWTFEFKVGRFEPDIDNWETFYGNDYTHDLAGAFSYKLLQQIEFGLQGGWIRDRGQGFLPSNNIAGGRVKYQLFPLNAFVLFRGIYAPNQWFVPYIGGGFSRTYYKINIENQSNIDGAENGTHYRAGIQFLLNNINKKGTRNLRKSYGIINTYFFIEVQKLKAEVDSLNLDIGGKSTMMGVLLEY